MAYAPEHRRSGRETILAMAVLAAVLMFSLLSSGFVSTANLLAIARNSVELLVVSLGMTFVVAMGGIDISIGAAMGIVAIAIGKLLSVDGNPFAAIVAGPVVGGGIGLVTATMIVVSRIPPIVATVALLGVYRTVIYFWLGGRWLSGLPTTLTQLIDTRLLPGVSISLAAIPLLYAFAFLILRRAPFGLHVLSIGNSIEKARLLGVPVYRTQFLVYVFSGVMAGLAAVYYVGTYRNVEMTIGGTLALDSIVSVVLGGTAIQGGKASLLGTAIAAVLIRLLQNGFTVIGIPSLWQPVITGGLLIGVLCFEFLVGLRHGVGLPLLGRR